MKKSTLLASLLSIALLVSLAFAASTKYTDLATTGNIDCGGNLAVTGNSTVTGNQTISGNLGGKRLVLTEVVNVAVATPTVVGQLVVNSNYVLYIATGTASPSQWAKVGAQ